MKTKTLLLSALVALVFVACQKENCGMLNLTIEGMGSDTKMAVNGNVSYWAEGDEVLINGNLVTINPPNESGNTATTSVEVESANTYYGVYPAGIYSDSTGASYTLDLPATYTYATTTRQGHTYQNLQSPMVGYTTGSSMQFKHVTGAINVQVVNYYGFTIAVDNIVVISDKYKLNGSVTVDMTNLNVATQTGSSDAEKRVEMYFNGGTSLHVFAGDSAIVQVPVLPVGNDNHFTVIVSVHKVDQNAVATTFEKTQNAGGELSRAKVGYARFTTPGLFSVSESKKVIISQGNLQYIGSANTPYWKFADNQYGYLGTTTGQNSADTDKDRDFFGWGTSGWNNGAEQYQPYSCVNNDSKYYNAGDITNTHADWGIHNSILNGGNRTGLWYTLASNEWDYLLSQRTAANRFVKASVAGVKGLIIFSDDYEHPADITALSNVNDATKNYGLTYISTAWVKMEAAGAVFLPAVGYRYSGTTVSTTAGTAYYWSSTKVVGSNKAYNVYLYPAGITTQNDNYSSGFSKGYFVRLVRDVN